VRPRNDALASAWQQDELDLCWTLDLLFMLAKLQCLTVAEDAFKFLFTGQYVEYARIQEQIG
jgi:hypothetical protein